MVHSFIAAVCFIVCLHSTTLAQDKAAAKLEAASDAYQKQMEAFRESVIKKFDQLEAQARKRSNAEAVEAAKRQRVAFKQTNVLPEALAVSGFIRKQNLIRNRLELAYKAAIKHYTTSNQDAEATRIQEEFFKFVESFDSLSIGSVWGGKHHQKFGKRRGVTTQGVKLVVTRRSGYDFEADITVENGSHFPVKGTMVQGKINFLDTKKGHKYSGGCAGQKLVVDFTGFSGALNTSTSGRLDLNVVKSP